MAKRKKRTRLRAWGRWTVWVCTGLLIVSIPVSYLVRPCVSISYVLYDDEGMDHLRYIDIRINDGIIRAEYFPRKARGIWSLLPIPGWDMNIWGGENFPPNSSHWWSAPKIGKGGTSVGPYQWCELSLIYPTVLMVGWAIWLVRGRRKLRRRVAGCCLECGYSLDGLNTDVCPECGVTHGEA